MEHRAIGSEHWQVVSLGLGSVSETPEELWENACKYFMWCDENPLKIKKKLTAGKKAGDTETIEYPRPYTTKGLCLHCGIMEDYISDLRCMKDKESLYYIVISKILYIIYVQNMELATVGVFNPIFTAKVLNMDKEETGRSVIEVSIVNGLPTLSKTENEVLKKLELENENQGK